MVTTSGIWEAQGIPSAIDTNVAKKWWIKVLLKLVNTYSVDPTNPLATMLMNEVVRKSLGGGTEGDLDAEKL